jgi:[acyl-carrier-protein] S-malonyltransferase
MGAMAALLGLDYETGVSVAQEACAASGEHEICAIANDNGGGQVVASGTKKAVDQAIEIAKGKGARRAMLLSVSAPFHCALMQPAATAMEEALGKVQIAAPEVPVIANVTARPVTNSDEIRRALVAQVTGTVRWRESVAFMASAGVDRFLELGSGKVLTGLLKRIAEGAIGMAIGTPADIASYTARAA